MYTAKLKEARDFAKQLEQEGKLLDMHSTEILDSAGKVFRTKYTLTSSSQTSTE